MSDLPHVVLVGAGFAGVGALQELQKAPVRVTIVDRTELHTFQPLLYQVATGQLGREHISSPVRSLLPTRDGFAFIQGDVEGIDLDARSVRIRGREPLRYDYLLVATGALVNFFGTGGAREHSLPLYTMSDALRLRSRIMTFLRPAHDVNPDPDGVARFCVIGGGATGVETAGALAELFQEELRGAKGSPSRAMPEVHLFEMGSALLTSFKPRLREYTRQALERRGVSVHLGEAVDAVEPHRIGLRSGRLLGAHTVVWAAGLEANTLARAFQPDFAEGRPGTEPDLSVTGYPEAFLAGDMASIRDANNGEPLPQLGSVAQQSGHRAGANIASLATGRTTSPFQYKDKGTMAMIGRGDAVVQLRSGRTMTGRPAFMAWKAVHLMLLKGGEQKASTLLEWGKGYVRRRSR